MKIRIILGSIALCLLLSVPIQASVVADPSWLDGYSLWGFVSVGETRTATIILRNEGAGPEIVTGISLEYSVPQGFSIQTAPLPHTLEPSEETAIEITFTPTFDSTTMGQIKVEVQDNFPFFIDMYGWAVFASTEIICDDGLDNDSDGLTDCDDPECASHPEYCPQVNDSDTDGIEDAYDNCAFVPNGPGLGTCTGDSAGKKCLSDSDCTLGEQCSMNQEDSDKDGLGDVCDPFDLTITPEDPGPEDDVNLKGKYNDPTPEPGIRLIVNREVVEECEALECEHTDGPYPDGMAFKADYRDIDGEWTSTDEMYAVRDSDPDWDDDGLLNSDDNCLNVPNGPELGTCTRGVLDRTCTNDADCWPDGFCSMNQEDSEFICLDPDPHGGCNTIPQMGDGIGDACDDDDDDDGCLDTEDPNPQTPSGDVEVGDFLCLPGGFGDGVAEDCDNCPDVCNPGQEDQDGDGLGDRCDNCPLLAYAPQTDTDNDRVGDACDNCRNVPNESQTDTDGDGSGNACDDDDDNDLCLDEEDDNPTVFSDDFDGDGLANDCDNDDDGDGYQDWRDALPLDPTEWWDDDGDGIGNNSDICPLYAYANPDHNIDSDGDGEGDACDCDDLLLGGDEVAIDSGGACPAPVECTWCGEEIEPLRLRGRPNDGYIDIVFVPHTSWEGRLPEFREYIKDFIRKKFMKLDTLTFQDPRETQLIEPIPEDFRDRFNFYIDVHGYGEDNDCAGVLPGEEEYQRRVEVCILSLWIWCKQDEVVHFWDYASFADVGALIADPYIMHPGGGLSGCAKPLGPPSGTGSQFFASVLNCNDDSPPVCVDQTYETGLHESGHSVFGLIDEYDGDTYYNLLQQYLYNEEPSNVWRDFWGSSGDPGYGMDYCEDFALAHGLDPFTASPHTGCRQFTTETTLPYVRFDRDDDDIMQKSRGPNSIFREACTWVITDVFNHWPSGRTKGILTYLEFDGEYFKPLYTKIVNNHPDIYEKTHAISVEVLSAENILLKKYGIGDPRVELGEPAVIRDTAIFPLFAVFSENVRWIILKDLESQGIMGTIDLAPAIYRYCHEIGFQDSYCQEIDLDANGIPDGTEPEAWIPEQAIGKICFPELDPPQCVWLDQDYDSIFNSQDNCPLVANPLQEDTNGNGVGDVCEEIADGDGDGILDTDDYCPDSDLQANLIIEGCDTGVANLLNGSGCSLSDLIRECAVDARNHGAFVSCVSHLTNDWRELKIITGREKGAITSCAARSNTP